MAFFYSTGVPSDAKGAANDYCLDKASAASGVVVIYKKGASAWAVNSVAAHHQLLRHSGVPAAALGRDGNAYFDHIASAWYGPKAAGAWPTIATDVTA